MYDDGPDVPEKYPIYNSEKGTLTVKVIKGNQDFFDNKAEDVISSQSGLWVFRPEWKNHFEKKKSLLFTKTYRKSSKETRGY